MTVYNGVTTICRELESNFSLPHNGGGGRLGASPSRLVVDLEVESRSDTLPSMPLLKSSLLLI